MSSDYRSLRPLALLGRILVVAMMLIPACVPSPLASPSASATPADARADLPTNPPPTQRAPTELPLLATPVSQEPAAGICDGFDGPVVEFRIEPGIPDPRCARVRPDQHLKVVNKTDGPLDLMIGTYSSHLEPGGETVIDTPFGDYLAPGVHLLQVLPCCGPELWLEGGSN